MDNIFKLIDNIEEENYIVEFESIKNEILSQLPEETVFESIVSGDNFIRSTFSKIFKNILNIDTKSKIEFDIKVFEKIDKSKISKDVTGVATPEYVKTFCDIMTAKLLSSDDANRLKYLLSKFKEGSFNDDFKSKLNILLTADILSVLGMFTTMLIVGVGELTMIFLILGVVSVIAMAVTALDITKYKGSVTIEEIHELIDLIAKLLNVYVHNGNTSVIDEKSYKSAERLIEQLKSPSNSTITVADQNKVADMLLEVSKNVNKDDIIGFKKARYLVNISQTVKILTNNDIQADSKLLGKIEGINRLANHACLLSKAIAEASNTIMRDIRKW